MNQRVGTYANVASPVSAVTHSPPHAYGVCVFGSFLRVVQCKLMKMTPNEGANEGEGAKSTKCNSTISSCQLHSLGYSSSSVLTGPYTVLLFRFSHDVTLYPVYKLHEGYLFLPEYLFL